MLLHRRPHPWVQRLGSEVPYTRPLKREPPGRASPSCERNCFAQVIVNATPFFRGVWLYQHHLINIHVIRVLFFIRIHRRSVPGPNLHSNARLCPAGLPSISWLCVHPQGKGRLGAGLISGDRAQTPRLRTQSVTQQAPQAGRAGQEVGVPAALHPPTRPRPRSPLMSLRGP